MKHSKTEVKRMLELWKPVQRYEGLYEVSNMGNVRSLDRTVPHKRLGEQKRRGKMLSPRLDSYGYPQVILSRNGCVQLFCVHRLVGEAFLSNPEDKPCINHLNGIKADNRAENLEFCTYSENLQHAYDTGLRSRRRRVKHREEERAQ